MNIKSIPPYRTQVRRNNAQTNMTSQNPNFGSGAMSVSTRRNFIFGLVASFLGGASIPVIATRSNASAKIASKALADKKSLNQLGIGVREELIKVIGKKILPEWEKSFENAETIAITFMPKNQNEKCLLETLDKALALKKRTILKRNSFLVERVTTGDLTLHSGDTISLKRNDVGAFLNCFRKEYAQKTDIFPKQPSEGTAQYFKNRLYKHSSQEKLNVAMDVLEKLGWRKEENGNIVRFTRGINGESISSHDISWIFNPKSKATKFKLQRSTNPAYATWFEFDKSKELTAFNVHQNEPYTSYFQSPFSSASPMSRLAILLEKAYLNSKFPS